jgi:hypothetical protein
MTKQRDELTELLRAWADAQSPTAEEKQRLHARVTAALSGASSLAGVPPELPPHRSAAWGRVVWFALGAAAVLAAVLIWPRGEGGRSALPPAAVADDPQAFAMLPAADLAQKAALLAEVQRLFADHLAWIAENGREVRIGTAADDEKAAPGASVVVRVVVVARKRGTDAWTPVWKTDAVIRGEQVVELAPTNDRDGRLQLWAYPLADGTIAVDADLRFAGALPVQFDYSGLQKAGVPSHAFSAKGPDAEYRVYQTVALLGGKVG